MAITDFLATSDIALAINACKGEEMIKRTLTALNLRVSNIVFTAEI